MLKKQDNNPIQNTSNRVKKLIQTGKKYGKEILAVAILVAGLSSINLETRPNMATYNTTAIEQMQSQANNTSKSGEIIHDFSQLNDSSQEYLIMGVYKQLMNTKINIEINNNKDNSFVTVLDVLLEKTLTDNDEAKVQIDILKIISNKLIDNKIIKINPTGTLAVVSYNEDFLNSIITELEEELNTLYVSKGIVADIQVHGTVQQIITSMNTSGVIKQVKNNS